MALIEKTGKFPATVNSAELGKSKNDTPFVRLDFGTAEGSISRWLYLSEKAFEYSFKTLKEAFEFDGDFENLGQLVGKECQIVIREDANSDEKRLEVAFINAPGGSGSGIDDGERKSLAERLNIQSGFIKEEATTSDGDPF